MEKITEMENKIATEMYEIFKRKQKGTKKKLTIGNRGELLSINPKIPFSFSISLKYKESGKPYKDYLNSRRIDEKLHEKFMIEIGKMDSQTQFDHLENIRQKLRKKIEE